MTNTEYKKLIEKWTKKANKAGLRLSNGDEIPLVFWKTFLGLTRTVHIEIMNNTYNRKQFSANLTQTLRFAQRLSPDDFLEEVRRSIPEYEANKRK